MRIQTSGEGLDLLNEEDEEIDEETLTRMQEGLAQLEAGDTLSWDDYMKERRKRRSERATVPFEPKALA